MTIRCGASGTVAERKSKTPMRRATDKTVAISALKVMHLLFGVRGTDLSELARQGDTDLVNHRIRVHSGLSMAATLETILHEAWHAILDVSGLTRVLGIHEDGNREEHVVSMLTTASLTFIRDNPSFIHALLNERNWELVEE